MKATLILIILSIVLVSGQDNFPPCKWTAGQWTTFKQCLSSQSNEIMSKCIRQQTSAKEWNTIKNSICSNQSKTQGLKNCLLKDTRLHSNFLIFFRSGDSIAAVSEDDTIDKAQSLFSIPQLEKLDDDTLLKVFDKLDFISLLEFADINSRFGELISNNTMISKFQLDEKKLRIDRTWNENILLYDTYIDSIEVSQYDKVLKILRNFGHLITQLEFESDRGGNESETKEIARHIDKYCSSSLREITVLNDRINVIGQFRSVFDRVENVTLYNIYHQKSIQIARIFPMTRKLEAQVLITVTNLTFLEYRYPNLDDLRLAVMFTDNNYLRLHNLLRLNPQLQSFQISNLVNVEFLRGVNEFLPKLETLYVASIPSVFFGKESKVIRFKNVKHFSLLFYYGNKDEMAERFPFAFDQLETLNLFCDEMPENWFEFIMENKLLNTLILPREVPALNYSRLTTIIEAAPDLKEMRLRWERKLISNGIDKLMNEETKLERIHHMVPYDDHKLFLQNILHIWKVVKSNSNDFENPKTTYTILNLYEKK